MYICLSVNYCQKLIQLNWPQALLAISLEELCETANALLAPVRFGVARPTAPFNLSSGDMIAVEELFSVEPLAPRSHNSALAAAGSASQLRRSR
jgi:hypothetical protein